MALSALRSSVSRNDALRVDIQDPAPADYPDGLPSPPDAASSLARDANTIIKRGRGLSTSANLLRQRSLQSASRSQAFTDSGTPPQLPSHPSLRRSPSLSQTIPSNDPRSISTGRSLSRSQSNVSLMQSTPASPASDTPMPDFFAQHAALGVQKDHAHSANGTSNASPSRSIGVWQPPSETASPALSRVASSVKAQNLKIETTRNTFSPVTDSDALASPRNANQMPAPGSLQIRPVPLLEIVLKDLFETFIRMADAKIDNCGDTRARHTPQVEDLCGSGADPTFDQLLVNMGYVAKSNPRTLFDKVIAWKHIHERNRLPTQASQRTPTGPAPSGKKSIDVSRGGPESRSFSAMSNRPKDGALFSSVEMEISERKAAAATFILCRTLIEALWQTSLDALSKQLAVILEEIAFDGTVNNITREELSRSSIQRAKWSKSVELLGVLSTLDFGGVVGRYNLQLKRLQSSLGDRNLTDLQKEGNIINLLRGLRSLRPRADSETAWFQISAGIASLAEHFLAAHGEVVKMEYGQTIETLLLRTASSSQTHFDDAKWRKMLGDLNNRLTKMSQKVKYSSMTFQTQIAVACASPRDMFQQRWQSLVETAPKYLRERQQTRLLFLKAACRMTWCYLHRKYDSEGIRVRSIEELVRAVFFSGRKYNLSREPASIEPLTQLVRVIGANLPSTCFRCIISPLLNTEAIESVRDGNVQNLDPERTIIGIRSFLALISDFENNAPPDFPLEFGDDFRRNESPAVPMGPLMTASGRPRKASLIHGKAQAEPVETESLNDTILAQYYAFCETLTKLLRVCDNGFGGQASVDEKFATAVPKTPLVEWSFAKRDELLQQNDEARLGFYDLLHVAVQALPRCVSRRHPPSNEVLNLLCTGTAHADSDIADSSTVSLKSIAQHGWAQDVVSRFSAFIFKYETRYATMSDGGDLGPNHIERTLRLYIDLLHIWVEELQRRRSQQASGVPSLDVSTTQSYVDRAEAQGLFFLCSPSNRVRAFAVKVFDLVKKLDNALGETHARLLDVFSPTSPPIYDANQTNFSGKEKAQLARGFKRGNVNGEILSLSKSTDPTDRQLWYKIFPYVVKAANKSCVMTVSQTREDVCARLSRLQQAIEGISNPPMERPRATTVSTIDSQSSMGQSRAYAQGHDIKVEQWRLYLVFACATITKSESSVSTANQDHGHTRQSSRSSQNAPEPITSAQDLFSRVVPLLFCQDSSIRQAAVSGLASVNVNIFKLMLDHLTHTVRTHSGDAQRHTNHVRAASSPRRELSGITYELEAVQVYEATAYFLQDDEVCKDERTMDQLAQIVREISLFLNRDGELQTMSIKAHFCGLLERFYLAISNTNNPSRWMSFKTRKATYVQIENWWDETSPGDNRSQEQHREGQNLRFATASAMAALCAGPLYFRPNDTITDQFQTSRILGLIDVMLKSDGDRIQNSGKRALRNLILHNRDQPDLFQSTVEKLYEATKPTTLESYLEVLIDVASDSDQAQILPNGHWKLLSILLFTLGSVNGQVRVRSLKLLRIVEDHYGNAASLRSFDLRVSDKIRAVNSAAQYDVAEEMVLRHKDLAYSVFSEYARHFVNLPVDSQRNMIHVMLPWMKQMELQVDPNGQPTPTTMRVMMNMLLITVKCESKLHYEIQALWHALIDNTFPGNPKAIIDFVINLALQSKNESFIKTARQVAVYMHNNEYGKGIYAYVLGYVSPKTMKDDEGRQIPDLLAPANDALFIASPSQIFENMTAQIPLSIGQLSLILLVDLIMENNTVPAERIPFLLQAVFVLWDHHLPIVQDAARDMLVHLLHVLVISKEAPPSETQRRSAEDLVEFIRRQDSRVVWDYNDSMAPTSPYELPEAMHFVVSETVSLFNSLSLDGKESGIGESLAETSVIWATSCVVRHQACRSWHVYRCLLRLLTPGHMPQMLSQLLGTASDPSRDIQCYAMDVVRVLRYIAESQPGDSVLIPQVFWGTCALLYSFHEHEFMEAMYILGHILDRCDMGQRDVVERFLAARPATFDPNFHGVSEHIYNGVRSAYSIDNTLAMLDRLLQLPSSPLVGDESRLRITLLANIPRLLHSFEDPTTRTESLGSVSNLQNVCNRMDFFDMAQALDQFRNAKFRTKQEFLSTFAHAATDILAGDTALDSFRFTMGMLNNTIDWVRWETLRLLDAMVPFLQPLNVQLGACGPGLFKPLLRLTSSAYCGEALKIIHQLLPPTTQAVSQHAANGAASVAIPEHNMTAEDAHDPYKDPHGSGWCVSSPEIRQSLCRKNFEALYSTATQGTESESQQVTPSFQFQQEYFPPQEETTIGSVTVELEDMDNFFDIAPEQGRPGMVGDSFMTANSSQMSFGLSTDGEESRRFTPSPRTSNMSFSMSKRRQPSLGMFSNGYSHTPPLPAIPGSADPHIMSPSAFASQGLQQTRLPARPQTLSRSITMPVNEALDSMTPSKHDAGPSSPEREPFSDDDMQWSTRPSPRKSEHLDSSGTIRQDTFLGKSKFAGLRSLSLKRLTSNVSDKHRRAQTASAVRSPLDHESSPQVPRVPEEFLTHTKTAE